MVLLTCLMIHGIEENVRMNMVAIRVSANDHLMPRQIFLRKLCGDLQCQLRRNLTRHKRLDDVVALPPIQFAQLSLGVHHLLILKCRITVQVGREHLFLGFVTI